MSVDHQSLVSVIMPFLDAGPYIAEAIQSVLTQSYPHWELLLINDGSSDGSREIALDYVKRERARLRYLEHAGGATRGASASRNLGLENARGEYVAFLDADDVYLPGKLESQIRILGTQPDAGAVYGATQSWYSWTGLAEDRNRDVIPDLHVPTDVLYAAPDLLRLFLTRQAPVPCTCSMLVRRSAILDAGGFEDSFRYIHTDQVFYTKLFLRSAVFVSSGCWDRYRRRPDSCYGMVKSTGERAGARLKYLHWVRQYLREQGVQDATLLTAVEREIWRCEHPRLDRVITQLNRTREATARRIRHHIHSVIERR